MTETLKPKNVVDLKDFLSVISCLLLLKEFCFSIFNRLWCSNNILYLLLYNERRKDVTAFSSIDFITRNLANDSLP